MAFALLFLSLLFSSLILLLLLLHSCLPLPSSFLSALPSLCFSFPSSPCQSPFCEREPGDQLTISSLHSQCNSRDSLFSPLFPLFPRFMPDAPSSLLLLEMNPVNEGERPLSFFRSKKVENAQHQTSANKKLHQEKININHDNNKSIKDFL